MSHSRESRKYSERAVRRRLSMKICGESSKMHVTKAASCDKSRDSTSDQTGPLERGSSTQASKAISPCSSSHPCSLQIVCQVRRSCQPRSQSFSVNLKPTWRWQPHTPLHSCLHVATAPALFNRCLEACGHPPFCAATAQNHGHRRTDVEQRSGTWSNSVVPYPDLPNLV